jgi:hypothetical protein
VKHGVDSQAEHTKSHHSRYPSEDTAEQVVRISPYHEMSVTLVLGVIRVIEDH